jgi:excisionase family DNA binding protein
MASDGGMEAIQVVQNIAPAFLNASQTAEFLGVSPGMVRKMIRDERLPIRRFGRCVRVPAAWLVNEAASAMKGE